MRRDVRPSEGGFDNRPGKKELTLTIRFQHHVTTGRPDLLSRNYAGRLSIKAKSESTVSGSSPLVRSLDSSGQKMLMRKNFFASLERNSSPVVSGTRGVFRTAGIYHHTSPISKIHKVAFGKDSPLSGNE